MAVIDNKKAIQNAIEAFGKGNLASNALDLFKTLGYNTERQASLDKPNRHEFKETYIDNDSRFNEDKALFNDWYYVDLLFQLSKEEILKQTSLFDTKRVDRTIIETYLFFTIELSNEQYSRTEIANITREINKVFPMPVMVLFKYGQCLTLSVINRRLHKRNDSKDVLEKVTLIKDIRIDKPHRAHVEVLFDLSFDELKIRFPFTNFVELHEGWQKTLDTKELNKRFFQELSNWYFYAQDHVRFPNEINIEENRSVQINLIRLITRLIFVWFLKEKTLVDDNLFQTSFLKSILKSFNPNDENGKNYYPAVLQNLFFATLNQKMSDRSFIEEGTFKNNKDQYGIKTLYRYSSLFSIPQKEIIKLFKDIPFLNGGLFDCLDKENEETGKVVYIDGFSRNQKKVPNIPDFLFFGEKDNVDLTEHYGDKKRKKEQFKGIIKIFEDYKFTIEENTPVEEEIALDPELLGKVFENLLAYYNPETESTARKLTGSFYTPREVVDFMVDESLLAYLKPQLLTPNQSYIEFGKTQTQLFGDDFRKGQLSFTETINSGQWQNREVELESILRHLIYYNNDRHPFNELEVQQLIFAIDHCKILDPACGSGAFPMGILHKLVYLLGKLDPDNTRWRELQKQKAQIEISKAFDEKDKKQREEKLIEINATFEDNASDYGRKLYLIENCIYGVDLQAIAVQISKLRFFISLVVDQKEKTNSENRGIRPLPNLETKFVAANTLISLDKSAQLPMGYDAIYPLQDQLQIIRHKHFEAKSRKEKLRCQKEDKRIRKVIVDKLISIGLPNKDAEKISSFDIYDQSASADWFDQEWMFGSDLSKGFDIVLGNPPYISYYSGQAVKIDKITYEYFIESYDFIEKKKAKNRISTIMLFLERTYKLLKEKGIATYIIDFNFYSDAFFSIRKYLTPKILVNFIVANLSEFENVASGQIIFSFKKVVGSKNHFPIYNLLHDSNPALIDQGRINDQNNFSYKFSDWEKLVNQIKLDSKRIDDVAYVISGMNIGGVKDFFLAATRKTEKYHKAIFSGNVFRYKTDYPNEVQTRNSRNNFIAYDKEIERHIFENNLGTPSIGTNDDRFRFPKLMLRRPLTGDGKLAASFSNDPDEYSDVTIYLINETKLPLKFLLGIINSKLASFYCKNTDIIRSEKGQQPQITINRFKEFPIKIVDDHIQNTVITLSNYLLFLNQSTHREVLFQYFDRIMDAVIYEIYLKEITQSGGAGVLQFLANLRDIETENDEIKGEIVEQAYRELSDPKHPITTSLLKLLNVNEISIIEGRK